MTAQDLLQALPLQGERIRLTSLFSHDLPKLQIFFNDLSSLKYYLPTTVRPYNDQQLDKLLLDWNDGNTSFVFAVRIGEQLIGLVNLDGLDWTNSNAEVGIALVDGQHKGQGYAKEALLLLCDFAFNELGLHRLWARIIEENLPSLKLFESAGFSLEGKMRQQVLRRGKWLDMTIWGILNDQN